MAKIDSPKIRREIKDWLTPDQLEQLIAAADRIAVGGTAAAGVVVVVGALAAIALLVPQAG
jgi:hypothetical protein